MDKKVVLILVDGMRPDAFESCGNPFVESLKKIGECRMNAQTVMPSVTLPCHMSLFHSAEPSRHGILSNTYVPQIHYIEGLIDRIAHRGGKCAMFYNWEELRDLCRPGDTLDYSLFINEERAPGTDVRITDAAVHYIQNEKPDFVFLYLGETDEVGHGNGWMSEKYLETVNTAIDCVKRVYDILGDDYSLILTADHGGHDRGHGSDMPEDMTIPIICIGKDFKKGADVDGGSIKDIAPTIVDLMGIEPVREWEGTSLA